MAVLSFFSRFLAPSHETEAAHRVYAALVGQARQPEFYTVYELPDTLDGRFEAILLHLFAFLHRLKSEKTPAADRFSRRVSEAFFADMDRSLREIGVTDTGVAKRIKRMAKAYGGRLQAYDTGLASPQIMEESLKRNAYGTLPIPPEAVSGLAEYMHRLVHALGRQPFNALSDARIDFHAVSEKDVEFKKTVKN